MLRRGRRAVQQCAMIMLAIAIAGSVLIGCGGDGEDGSNSGSNPEVAAREFVSAAYSEVSVSSLQLCHLMTDRLQERFVTIKRLEVEDLNKELAPITGETDPLPETCPEAIEGWDEQYGDDRDHPNLSSFTLTGESGDEATATVIIEGGSEPYEKRIELRNEPDKWLVDGANLNPGESGPEQEPLVE